jgi:serpin B
MSYLFTVLAMALPIPSAVPSEVEAVVTANNQFALDLYHQLRGADGSLFLSPYCINKALALAYAGARGDTATEMAGVLHYTLGQDRQHQAFLAARKLLNQNSSTFAWINPFGNVPQLYLSTNLWGQQGYGFQKSYLNLMKDYYDAGLNEVDFTDAEPARQTINRWVEKQTNNRIHELIQQGTLNAATRLVLGSAIYFKGEWDHRFQKHKSTPQAFWISAERKVEVPMMSQVESFGYFENDELQALRMPYQGGKLAMIVLLPKKRGGLADLEKTLTAATLATWMGQLQEQKVDVSLPRFTQTDAFQLNAVLAALGMKKAFSQNEADFSGMNGSREPLFLSAVMHKAFVDVNEEGTEAAAATGIVAATMAMPTRSAVPVFRADHPFVFAIADVRTGMILFLGRMAKP